MATKKKIKFDPDKERVVTFSRDGEKLSEVNGELKSDFYSGIEKMCYLSDEYCAFYKGKKMGILDSKGEMITPAEWLSIKNEGEVFMVSRKNKVTKSEEYGYINSKGEELFNPEEYTSVNDVCDGRIVARNLDAGKFGAFDLEGNVVVAPVYTRLGNFHNNVAVAFEEKEKVGLVDPLGNWALQPEYTSINGFGGVDGLLKYCVVNKDGKYGLLDQELKTVVEPKYDDITDFDDTEGLIIVVMSGEKQGVVDGNGNWLIPAEYDSISLYHDDRYLKLEKQSGYGIADLKGNIIADVVYNNLYFEHGLLRINSFDGMEIKRTDGTTIFKGKDAKIFEDLIVVTSDRKLWGVINHEGKEILPMEWTMPGIQFTNQLKFSDGLLNLTKDGKTIYIDEKGDIKISLDTRGWAFSNGYAISGTKDDYSIINMAGETVATNIAHLLNLGGGYFYINNVEENEPQILNVSNGERTAIPARTVGKPNNGLIKIQGAASKYGVVEISTGKVILEPVYSEVLLTAAGVWGSLPKAK